VNNNELKLSYNKQGMEWNSVTRNITTNKVSRSTSVLSEVLVLL